jgi:hypothetical protein
MRGSRRTGVAVALALGVLTTSLAAQQRGGFFFGIGAGYGSNWTSCSSGPVPETCASTTRSDGFAGFFKIGAHLNEQFGLGFESNGWFGSVESADVWSSNFSGVVYFYPGAGNLMLRGGLGLATAEISTNCGLVSTCISTETGFGATVGIGYDFPVGFVAVLNPVVNLNYGSFGDVRTGSGDLQGVSNLVLQLAVGLTFQ